MANKNPNKDTKTYLLPVEFRQEENLWQAFVPELEDAGLVAWGKTKVIALRHLEDAAQIRLITNASQSLRQKLPSTAQCLDEPVVAVYI